MYSRETRFERKSRIVGFPNPRLVINPRIIALSVYRCARYENYIRLYMISIGMIALARAII
jgi:hypothetical protein